MPTAEITFRASAAAPCPVCGSPSKGCSGTSDGLQFCRGEPRPGWKRIGEDEQGFGHFRRQAERPARPGANACGPGSAAATPRQLQQLADALRLPAAALAALPVGWDGEAWTTPEVDAAGDTVGVSRRFPNGKKYMQRGGHRGLVLPRGWRDRAGPAFVVEGMSDALAATHAGLCCVGRPNNAGGAKLLAELFRDWPAGRPLVVVGENDRKPDGSWPGKAGAEALAAKLTAALGRPVVVALPPAGAKDVRDWLTARTATGVRWPNAGRELGQALIAAGAAPTAAPAATPAAAAPNAKAAKNEADAKPTYRPDLVRMSDVTAVPVPWLWADRIPLGRITLLVGRPGAGKSWLTCWLAATVSRGWKFPDGCRTDRGSVVLMNAEDNAADTLKPRLEACHADCDKVHTLTTAKATLADGTSAAKVLTLADVDLIETALEAVGDARLLVIDPVGSFIAGKVDAHRDNEVRGVLAPLAALAERHNVAVVLVVHTKKGGGEVADDTALGSRAFVGMARAAWHLSRDPEDKDRRLLLPGKNNLARERDGLAFRIEGDPPAVVFEDGPVTLSADDALANEARSHAEKRKPGPKADLRMRAARWLGEYLAGGPRTPREVEDAGDREGFPLRTLQRAADEIGVERYKTSAGGWLWKLPAAAVPA